MVIPCSLSSLAEPVSDELFEAGLHASLRKHPIPISFLPGFSECFFKIYGDNSEFSLGHSQLHLKCNNNNLTQLVLFEIISLENVVAIG